MTEVSKALESLSKRGWVSQDQLAAILGVNPRTVRAMRDRGEFDPVWISGSYRIYEAEVKRLLRERHNNPKRGRK